MAEERRLAEERILVEKKIAEEAARWKMTVHTPELVEQRLSDVSKAQKAALSKMRWKENRVHDLQSAIAARRGVCVRGICVRG